MDYQLFEAKKKTSKNQKNKLKCSIKVEKKTDVITSFLYLVIKNY